MDDDAYSPESAPLDEAEATSLSNKFLHWFQRRSFSDKLTFQIHGLTIVILLIAIITNIVIGPFSWQLILFSLLLMVGLSTFTFLYLWTLDNQLAKPPRFPFVEKLFGERLNEMIDMGVKSNRHIANAGFPLMATVWLVIAVAILVQVYQQKVL